MRRRAILQAGIITGASAVAGCLGSTDEPRFQEGFEDGLRKWTKDSAISEEPDPQNFEQEVGVSQEQAAEEEHSLRIWNVGDYDDGMTWVVHPISIEPGEAYDVEVTAQFWSETESFNILRHAVMRLGPDLPETEKDFPDPGQNTTPLGETPYGGLREPLSLTAGWREYAFTWTTPTLSTETLYLAVGTGVAWESDIENFVDDITVEIESQ